MGKILLKWSFYPITVLLLLLLIGFGSRSVTVISETMPLTNRRCFVIDPGHGGVDGGAISCTGRPESQYNLEISLRLRDLMNFLGCKTRMIRTTDISVYTQGDTIAQKKISDLKQRVRICGEYENTILLSIHQNTFSDSRYHGPQVFFAQTEGSEDLARHLQADLTAALDPDSSRQAKKASGIYLLDHVACPAVLIECGFLSNHKDEAALRSPDYQKELCCVIASSITSHFSEE